MNLIIKAKCMSGGRYFDGLCCDECFSDYFDDRQPDCVSGGYMRFEYNEIKDALYVITEYETTRKLMKEEEKEMIEYTQGQWSDGIGEGFEQEEFDVIEDGTEVEIIYNPSPWYYGQKVKLFYEK